MEEPMKKEIKSNPEPVDVLDNSEPNESPDMREMDVPETEKDEAPSVDELRKAEADMKERIGVNMSQPDMRPQMMPGNNGEFTMNPFARAFAQQPAPLYCQSGNSPIPPGENLPRIPYLPGEHTIMHRGLHMRKH